MTIDDEVCVVMYRFPIRQGTIRSTGEVTGAPGTVGGGDVTSASSRTMIYKHSNDNVHILLYIARGNENDNNFI